jgi:uncharacterized protein YifE (UPF0438 family)
MPFKPIVSLIFLFCFAWQSTYSQLLYSAYLEDKKEEYLPPYDPNVVIISPEVEKWMNEQLIKPSEKKTIEMKTDVMGRVKSSTDKIEGGELKVVDNKQKRLVLVSDMHIRENNIEPEYASYEYNSETKKRDYSFNGKKISEKEYIEYLDKSLAKFKQEKRGKRDLPIRGVINSDDRSWTAWMTVEEISELTKNHKELVIDDYKESETTASVASILSTIQLSTLGHNNSYKGNKIGVYVMEANCRDANFPIVNSDKYTNKCTGTVDTHHSRVVNIVQNAAPLAHIFGFKSSSPYPSNPSSYSPPLEIGTHSYCKNPGGNLYTDADMNMDNYIYNNGVINFVAAGNQGTCNSTYDVSSPGKALNAITVGAVEPATNRYANYSRWKNPLLRVNFPVFYNQTFNGSDKPEIAMYTDIDMGIHGFINGTSAATPLAAGFTATLLEQHPFFKRKPALMKAVLLTGETIPIQNANSWDTDNYSQVAKGIANYSSVFCGWRSRWWSGGNSAHFDSDNNITFKEDNIQANKRYRIAISWLVDGGFVYQFGRLPQDIDLYVYQIVRYRTGTFKFPVLELLASSTSSTNPFEIVDFVTTSDNPLFIVIKRKSNHQGNVLLGYHLRENL